MSPYLLVALLAGCPSLVCSLSCAEDAFTRSRSVSIIDNYCDNDDVYVGKVLGATCNCYLDSSSVNTARCQSYELDAQKSTLSATLLAMGTCDNAYFRSSLQSCSTVGNSLSSSGLRVEGPNGNAGDVPTMNLTQGSGDCNLACPFNSVVSNGLQPCIYTVRVGEVYKGNYSTGQEIEVVGPDVLISHHARVLQVNTDYLVGIGGSCEPINEWSAISNFSTSELNILRQDITCGQCTLLPSITALLMASLLLLVLY